MGDKLFLNFVTLNLQFYLWNCEVAGSHLWKTPHQIRYQASSSQTTISYCSSFVTDKEVYDVINYDYCFLSTLSWTSWRHNYTHTWSPYHTRAGGLFLMHIQGPLFVLIGTNEQAIVSLVIAETQWISGNNLHGCMANFPLTNES